MTSPNAEKNRPDHVRKPRRVTQKDIARAVGISHVAVSKALKGQRGVSAENRARILEKAEEMGYVPAQNAENTRPAHARKPRRVTQKDIARAVGISHVAVSKALKGQRGVSAENRARILEKAKKMGYLPAQNAENDRADHDRKPRRVTQEDIARAVGISHVAVSKALKGQRGVSAATRARVLEKADELGYVPDPRLAVLSQYRHNSKTKPVQAELAWLNLWKHPEKIREYAEFNFYREGASVTAKRLGYRLQEFNAAESSMQRLDTILKTRNIQGILIPPASDHIEGWDAFPWSDYVTVLLGRNHPYPKTHFVSSAQTANTILAFNRMTERGYKRIGFTSVRSGGRYFGAGFFWAQHQLPRSRQLPALLFNAKDPEEKKKAELDQWVRKYRPDAILNDYDGLDLMLNDLGVRIPKDIGIAGTGINASILGAGINQKPLEIGRAAVRNLVALMAENSYGIPETRNEILIEGEWVNGAKLPERN